MDCPFRCGENFADKAEIAAHTGDNGSCPLAPVQCVFKGIGNGGCPAKVRTVFFFYSNFLSTFAHMIEETNIFVFYCSYIDPLKETKTPCQIPVAGIIMSAADS
eukprot:scpid72383/ scgid31067/ 